MIQSQDKSLVEAFPGRRFSSAQVLYLLLLRHGKEKEATESLLTCPLRTRDAS